MQRYCEIGESDVTSEGQIEKEIWRFQPQILKQEIDPLPVLLLYAKRLVRPIEGLPYKMRRQFPQARRLEAPLPRSRLKPRSISGKIR